MSVIGNPLLLGGDAGAPSYLIDRSVRFRDSASAYFNRTPASAGSRTTWTWSGWVKRGAFYTTNSGPTIFSAGTDGNNFADFRFISSISDVLDFTYVVSGSAVATIRTTQVFRDPSSWYHIVVALDTTQATSSDRIKLYVNGVRVTAFVAATYPAQNNAQCQVNATNAHYIGRSTEPTYRYMDGYLAEINFIDGQALTPSAFGEYDAVRNTQWKPKAYSGSWGTNGFYLKFANPASIGLDSSGNGNNWTANNIQTSNSALTTYDSMLDVPTLTSESASNFAVLNPLSGANLGSGNLQVTGSGAGDPHTSTIAIPEAGKWYCEMSSTAYNASTIVGWFGVANRLGGNFSGLLSRVTGAGAGFFTNDVVTTSTNIGALNDVFGVAVDRDAGVVKIYINNVLQASTPTIATGVDLFFYYGTYTSGTGWVNFGQRPFTYTPPTGFKALNTYSLPEPAITSSDDYHKVYTYTGNGGGQQVGEIQKPLSLYNLDRSIRLRSAADAYFSRAFSSSPTTFTFSCWVKRGQVTVQQVLAASRLNGAQSAYLLFNANGQINFLLTNGTAVSSVYTSTAVFKDPNLWYHVVFASTAGGTAYVYVNGAQVLSGAVPAGYWLFTNTASWVNAIGRLGDSATSQLDGYLADVHFVDGQALAPSDFGQYDGNYYWTPKEYAGTYGSRGFHLEFEDFSAATAAAIGKDTSGNGNNWTPNNISLATPEVDNEYWDSYTDVPTNNNADTCNYCTLDPLQPSSTGLRNGNLTAVWTTASSAFKQRGTYKLNTGKWYFEGNLEAFTIGNAGNTNYAIGFITTSGIDTHVSFGWTTNGTSMKLGYRYDVAGAVVQNVTYNTVTPVSTDIFGIEYDVDNGTANFYKNGTLMGSASGLALGEVNPHIWRSGTSNSATMHVNFGQRAFKYTPSTGYKKINAFNVAEVTGDLESPDFVWIKSRSAATGHALFNSVTGVGKYLSSNATTAETTDVNSLIQFNKNGFLLGNAAIVNTSAATYVASVWKSGSTTVTNTDGSISSQVRANPTAGISIVTYTGTGANATVGHGLGVAPKMMIVKWRTGGTTESWAVYHASLGATNYLSLNTTNASAAGASLWNNTAPTTSVFSVGTDTWVNASTRTYVAYCFSEIAGYSKFGSYTGNGAADGPFVYLGFRPRWILYKATGTADAWQIYDTSRNTSNATDLALFPYSTTVETDTTSLSREMDILSNGFKIRGSDAQINTNAATYIYAAFAEHPFKYSLAR